jgi:hypothetical protein
VEREQCWQQLNTQHYQAKAENITVVEIGMLIHPAALACMLWRTSEMLLFSGFHGGGGS